MKSIPYRWINAQSVLGPSTVLASNESATISRPTAIHPVEFSKKALHHDSSGTNYPMLTMTTLSWKRGSVLATVFALKSRKLKRKRYP